MSVSWNGPSVITPASGSAHSVNYELDTSQNDAYSGYTSRTYEHPANQQNTTAGITFYYNATTTKQYINVNIVGNISEPDYIVNTTTNTGGSGISEVEYTTGDVIQTWSAAYSGGPLCIFTVTQGMNFVVGSGGSGSGPGTLSNSGSLQKSGSNLVWYISSISQDGDYVVSESSDGGSSWQVKTTIVIPNLAGTRTGNVLNWNELYNYKFYDPLENELGSYSPAAKKVFCNFW